MPNPLLFSPEKPSALAIFCRAPRLGQVKTRLARTRGDSFALELYRAMLADCFALGRPLSPEIETFACFTPADGFSGAESLAGLWDGPTLPQCEGDLGAKMLDCLSQLRSRGHEKVAIIGSDAPDLPRAWLETAFRALDENELAVGESFDGGFYFLGASVAVAPSIFDGIAWSQSTVMARLIQNLTGKYRVHRLPLWRDVDEEDDLLALQERLAEGTQALHTRQFLELLNTSWFGV